MKETVLQRQQGFTLLEVLVALLIVSIGLLVLAALMSTSLKNNQGASQRSQATWLAYDVLDRMRANPIVAATANNGGYNINYGASPSVPGVAGTDLTAWKAELAAALPGGDGKISVNSSGVVTINVQWNDSRGLGLLTTNSIAPFAGSSYQQLTIMSQL